MPTIPQFDPPASLDDFDTIQDQRAAWDEYIALSFQRNIEGVESEVGVGKCQFYNPKIIPTDPTVAADVIRWKGFPLVIEANHPGDENGALKEAEQLTNKLPDGRNTPFMFRPQDEYLEWFVNSAQGKVTSVIFTCEGPEYWEALAHGYPLNFTLPIAQNGLNGTKHTRAVGDKGKLLALYRQFCGPNVQLADLLDNKGNYNRWNKWNTTHGVVHLNNPFNTLSAEINIAAQATILRKKNGTVINDPDALIRCSGFGEPLRASDPHIGDEVNTLARNGYAITLQNPVGLYMDVLETTGWATPDGTPAIQFWKPIRGGAGMTVRAMFEVPAALGYTVGDITIGGEPIKYGGQIAKHLNMKLTGLACRSGSFQNAALDCPGTRLSTLSLSVDSTSAPHMLPSRSKYRVVTP